MANFHKQPLKGIMVQCINAHTSVLYKCNCQILLIHIFTGAVPAATTGFIVSEKPIITDDDDDDGQGPGEGWESNKDNALRSPTHLQQYIYTHIQVQV